MATTKGNSFLCDFPSLAAPASARMGKKKNLSPDSIWAVSAAETAENLVLTLGTHPRLHYSTVVEYATVLPASPTPAQSPDCPLPEKEVVYGPQTRPSYAPWEMKNFKEEVKLHLSFFRPLEPKKLQYINQWARSPLVTWWQEKYLRYIAARINHEQRLAFQKRVVKRSCPPPPKPSRAGFLAITGMEVGCLPEPFGPENLEPCCWFQCNRVAGFETPCLLRREWVPRRRTPKERSDEAQAFIGCYPKEAMTPTPKRDPRLVARLRALLVEMRHDRVSLAVAKQLVAFHVPVEENIKWECADAQMDGVDGESLNTIQTNNVILTEENPGSMAIAAEPSFSFEWHKLCSSEPSQDYSHLTDRWTFFRAFEWTTDGKTDDNIAEGTLKMPIDFIDSVKDKPGTMPMFLPFKIHKYFKSDIEFKFHINSNKFQVGQLQFSWQYLQEYDDNPLESIYSRCQLPHVLVNAGASNEATLLIPYKYVQPYMFTGSRKNNLMRLYMGTLETNIVAPLAVGEGGPDKCSVSIFVRFPNSAFTGLVDGQIGDPEMEGAAAAMVAGALYNKFIGDKNCDNPSNNVNPQVLVPTASHNWSAGTGLSENVMSLRLDNSVKGVGRTAIDPSATSIGIPCRTFGMLQHITWSTVNSSSNTTGTHLWAVDVHPQLEKRVFSKYVPADGGLDNYRLPPVTVVSSLYKQWRGSLEFKFDIIASQFHTGRLLCAYIPGWYGDSSKITIEMARNCPHVEFSLQDSTSFTFTVPYISNSVFWPRKYTGPHKYSEHTSPSRVILFVLNPLIPMQSIVDHVVIVPYVRAGEDFEVSVPVQPALGLTNIDDSNISLKDLIYPTEGSYPMRVTNSNKFGDSKYYIFYEGTDTFGTASTFHAPEQKLNIEQFYYGVSVNVKKLPVVKWKNDNTKKTDSLYVGFIVLWSSPDGNYGIPFPEGTAGEARARGVAMYLKLGKKVEDILYLCYEYVEDSSSSSKNIKDLYFKPRIDSIKKYNNDSFEWLDVPQMDNRFDTQNNLAPNPTLPSTGAGRFNFNEKFDDLKDLCRRYQLYADKKIRLDTNYDSGEVAAIIPVIPSGLDLDITSPSSMFNMSREGHVPIVSSGYVFFRGSIRFRIVVNAISEFSLASKVWIQHHPDVNCDKTVMSVYPNILEEDNFRSHSYGFYIQSMSVNPIIEFEVPFYQPSMYGLCYPKPDKITDEVCQYYNLGTLAIGFYSVDIPKATNVNIQVFYSIGDDFSFSTFRGFPRMLFTDEVWPKDKKKKKAIVYESASPQMNDIQEGDPEMWLAKKAVSYMLPSSSDLKKKAKDYLKSVSMELISEFQVDLSTQIKSTLLYAKGNIKEHYDIDIKIDQNLLNTAIGNLLHILANPNYKSVGIAFANVLVALFGITHLKVVTFIPKCIDLFKFNWHRFCGNTGTAEGPMDSKEEVFSQQAVLSLCGLIFTGVSTIFGVSCLGPKAFPDILKHINGSVSLVNNVMRLLQNCSELLKYCARWCVNKIYPDIKLKLELCNETPAIKSWYEECMYLLDVRMKQAYLYDKHMMDRVIDANMVGTLLIAKGLDKSTPGGKVIFDTHKEIRKLQTNLFERGVHPDVRFETFPMWITGTPGIGKSYMVKTLCKDLLNHLKIQHRGSMIYDIKPGAKYWSGCENPAVLVSDDIFQVTGQIFEQELSTLFAVCSSTVLNPPMAAIEEKERRISPYIYIMNCNHAFPNLSPTCRTPEAIYRRRKFLIEADYTERVKEEYPDLLSAEDLPREEVEGLAHLRFRLAKNPRKIDTAYTEWMPYKVMMEIIKLKFEKHFFAEQKNFKQRMCDMYCLDPDFNDKNIIEELPALDVKTSLSEQIEHYKQYVAAKIDSIEDPAEDAHIAMKWIRAFADRVHLKDFVESGGIQSDDVVEQIPPVVTASPPPEPTVPETPEYDNLFLNSDFTLPLAFNSLFQTPSVECASSFIDSTVANNRLVCPEIFREMSGSHHGPICSKLHFHPLFEFLFKNKPKEDPVHLMPIQYFDTLMEADKLFKFHTDITYYVDYRFYSEKDKDSSLRWGYQAIDYLNSFLTDTIQRMRYLSTTTKGLKAIFAAVTDQKLFDAHHPYTSIDPDEAWQDDIPRVDGCMTHMLDSYLKSRFQKGKKEGLRKVVNSINVDTEGFRYQYLLTLLINHFFKQFRFKSDFKQLSRLISEQGIFFEKDFDVDNNLEIKLNRVLSTQAKIISFVVSNFDKVMNVLNTDNLIDHIQKRQLFDFALGVYSSVCFVNIVVDVGHVCDKRVLYNSVFSHPQSMKWCSVWNRLEGRVCDVNINLEQCDSTCCCFNLPIFRGLVVMTCHDHNSWRNVHVNLDSYNFLSNDNLFNLMEYIQNDLTNFKDIVRAMDRPRELSRLETFLNYVKDFTFHKLPHAISVFITFLYKNLDKIILALLAFIGLKKLGDWTGVNAFGLYSGIKDIANMDKNEAESHWKFDSPKNKPKPKMSVETKTFGEPQMGSEQREVLAQRLENNTVIIYANWYEDGKPKLMHSHNIMLRGHAMLTLRHYYEEMQAVVNQGHDITFSLFFSRQGCANRQIVTWDELTHRVAWCGGPIEHLTSNFGIVILPSRFPLFKDILKYFAPKAALTNPPSIGDLYVVNGSSTFGTKVEIVDNFKVNAGAVSSAVYMKNAFRYGLQGKGMCGSALVFPTLNSGCGAIGAVHVAGNGTTKYGYAEPIYKETFDEFFNKMCPQPVPAEVHFDTIDKATVKLDTNLLLYGTVPKEFAHSESGQTKIVPSLLHGEVFPVRTEVNPLRPNDPRQPPGSHPLRDGCNKHGTGNVIPFDIDDVDDVTKHLSDTFRQVAQPIRARVEPLSYQQAICGDPNVEHFQPLNWASSEGFPLSASRPPGETGKKWLFKLEEGQFGYILKGIHPKLQQQLALRDRCFEQNLAPVTIYTDCLKDFRLTPEKCKIPGKTRIFSIAPIQCTVDIKTYLGDFCASIKASRIKNSIGIGINPDSLEWTELVNYLFEVSGNIITLDYSNYGPSLMSQLVVAFNKVISNWHVEHGASEEHVKRVEWLLNNDILNPVHLCENVVYQTFNGIASGSPLTGECNSGPNIMYIRLTYLEIMKRHLPEYATMYWFDRLVRLVVYGDDLIMSVDDSIVHVFNACTIRDYLAQHGIKVTSAQKDQEMVPYTDIFEATFLKRSFRPHPRIPGVWLAPVDVASVEECINWIKKTDDKEFATLEVCRASADLAYSHGPVFYDQHILKIRNALNSRNIVFKVKDWRDIDNEIFGNVPPQGFPTVIKIKLPWTCGIRHFTL